MPLKAPLERCDDYSNYLGCEIQRNHLAGTTCLSQHYYAEDILRTFGARNSIPVLMPMCPNTRLSWDDCDLNPDKAFSRPLQRHRWQP
jgi:hypothetical protein